MADTWELYGRTWERCPECGTAKYVDEPCTKRHPEVPVVHTLLRPVVAGRYTTIDWDELRSLAEDADRAGADLGYDVTYTDGYTAGVRDALRWLADGIPTAELLQLLGG